MSSNPYK